MTNKIRYSIRKWQYDSGAFDLDIESEGLIFSQISGLYGLQCNKEADSEEYLEISRKCFEVVKLLKEIELLNQLQ